MVAPAPRTTTIVREYAKWAAPAIVGALRIIFYIGYILKTSDESWQQKLQNVVL